MVRFVAANNSTKVGIKNTIATPFPMQPWRASNLLFGGASRVGARGATAFNGSIMDQDLCAASPMAGPHTGSSHPVFGKTFGRG